MIASAPGARSFWIAPVPANMRQQQAQGHRCHAVDAAGLSDRAGPHRLQLLLDLVGKTAELGVIDGFRQLEG